MRVAHLGSNAEECWCTRIREYKRGDCGYSFGKARVIRYLVVGDPDSRCFGSGGRPVLDTDCDGNNEDWDQA